MPPTFPEPQSIPDFPLAEAWAMWTALTAMQVRITFIKVGHGGTSPSQHMLAKEEVNLNLRAQQ